MSQYVHGDNLKHKESQRTKYGDADSQRMLGEIRRAYDKWKKANIALEGPTRVGTSDDDAVLKRRTTLLNGYKDFIDSQEYAENFDSRSNLHSTVLEEFLYYLFRDLVESFANDGLVGKAHVFKDIFFNPPSYEKMLEAPHTRLETKDHDFVIGTSIVGQLKPSNSKNIEQLEFQIPAIAIECKTYLDKTMLEGSSTAGEQLKIRSPDALYIIVAEWLKLTENVNLNKFKVDQIYVLRKQKNTDREFRYLPGYTKNPIYLDVVRHLYQMVRDHLTADWTGGVAEGLQRGILI